MFNSHLKKISVALAAAATAASTAVATPGSGILGAPVFARANFQDPVDIKLKIEHHGQQILQVRNARQTVVQQIVISPGGQTGWHSHPGPVIVLVKAGTLTFYDGDDPSCSPRNYGAGQSFIDSGQGHVHYARNESASENLELWAVYFDVPTGAPFRIDAPSPGNCAF